MKEYNTTEMMTENRSVWHIKKKDGPLLLHLDRHIRTLDIVNGFLVRSI